MPDPSRRTLPLGLLAAILAAFPSMVRAQGLTDCAPPLRPAAVTDPRVKAEYASELREEYSLYFDDAQAFLRCLERARVMVTEEVNQAIADYEAIGESPGD